MDRCDQLTKVDLRGMKDLLNIELLNCESLEQVCLDDLHNLIWLDISKQKFNHIEYERFGILKIFETMY